MFWLESKRRRPRQAKLGKRVSSLRCQIEMLEHRTLLSATALSSVTAHPLVTTGGLTPTTIDSAYSYTGISSALSSVGSGKGQTIAIVDAYNDPNLLSDLATFDSKYGLAAPSIKVVSESGGSPTASNNADWGLETSLDVEWAHAVAPGANILLVEASSSNLNDLLTAVSYAKTATLNGDPVSVVSMSWGSSEFATESQYDSYFTSPSGHGVTFVASAGDSSNVSWPAVSPNVLSVGGTTLTVTSTGGYVSETAWSDSGGGVSRYETEPSYQVSAGITAGGRVTPDVAYNADPTSGYAVYDSYGQSGWQVVGGTSAGAPQWAGIIAIANQARAAAGTGTLTQTAADLYAIDSSTPAAFHDVTSGSNGYYSATTGYDAVTGLGTPVVSSIVSDLVNPPALSSSGSSGSGSSGSGTSGSGSSGSSGGTTSPAPPTGGGPTGWHPGQGPGGRSRWTPWSYGYNDFNGSGGLGSLRMYDSVLSGQLDTLGTLASRSHTTSDGDVPSAGTLAAGDLMTLNRAGSSLAVGSKAVSSGDLSATKGEGTSSSSAMAEAAGARQGIDALVAGLPGSSTAHRAGQWLSPIDSRAADHLFQMLAVDVKSHATVLASRPRLESRVSGNSVGGQSQDEAAKQRYAHGAAMAMETQSWLLAACAAAWFVKQTSPRAEEEPRGRAPFLRAVRR